MRTKVNAKTEFLARFRQLTTARCLLEVWTDFLTVSFCSICWTDNEVCQAEISAVEGRYQPQENELMAEMFALAAAGDAGFLEDAYQSFHLGQASKRIIGLMRYVQENLGP